MVRFNITTKSENKNNRNTRQTLTSSPLFDYVFGILLKIPLFRDARLARFTKGVIK